MSDDDKILDFTKPDPAEPSRRIISELAQRTVCEIAEHIEHYAAAFAQEHGCRASDVKMLVKRDTALGKQEITFIPRTFDDLVLSILNFADTGVGVLCPATEKRVRDLISCAVSMCQLEMALGRRIMEQDDAIQRLMDKETE